MCVVVAMTAVSHVAHMPRQAAALWLLAGLCRPVASVVELECQIFDETMVCDNERARLQKAEIRTCSG